MTYPHIQHLCNIAKHQRVLWVGNTFTQVTHTVACIRDMYIDGAVVKTSNGAQSVDFAEGGSIRFITPRSIARTRGAAFDHIFLDSHHYLDDPAIRVELATLFRQEAGGERYTVIG